MSDFATWVEKNKGLWARVYDEVIAPDFEKEWKKREDEHKQELKNRDENQQLLFNHINEQILRNARVAEENERLEAELQQRAESAAPSTTLDDATITSTSVLAEEHHDLAKKYDELSKKYQNLSQKVKYLERKNSAVMQKNKDMKDSVRAWQQYADRQNAHQKSKGATKMDGGPSRRLAVPQIDEASPHMPSSPRSVSSVRTALLHADRGQSSPAPDLPLVDHEAAIGAAHDEDKGQSPSILATPRGPATTSTSEVQIAAHDGAYAHIDAVSKETRKLQAENPGAPSSSQTTVDEGADPFNRRTQTAYVEDEDDMPQIVSERSLKRKRGQQSRLNIYIGRSSDGTPAKPHHIKDEPLSSPPPAMHALLRTETIDLDDAVSNHLETPRPPPWTPLMHSNNTGTSRHQRSSSAPFSQAVKSESTQRGQEAEERISNVQARLQIAAAEMRAFSEPMGVLPNDPAVLQSLDPNILAHTPTRSPNKRLKAAEVQRTEHGVLAESGEALPPVDENELRLPPSVARARFNQRMRAAKSPHTPVNRLQRNTMSGSPLVKPERLSASPTNTTRSAQISSDSGGSRRSASTSRTTQQEEIIPDGRPVWSMRALEKRSSAHKGNTPSSERVSRLRMKPVKELKVHDFKPNPAYNQGYSYAFSEAVRKRGDRMCLPGCTNSQCCGSTFRRLAEALGPLPASQEETLLEEYLGDAYSTVMSTQISSDERAELVLQARTKKMAKDTGKHREAYERRRTPPGFWRVDFPTTQEQEYDREQAKEQEIKTVQERWLEAQRKGGKWIFRDE